MPETPIETGTGTHPFDANELGIIRNLSQMTALLLDGGRDPDSVPLTLSYAATVMPAMADKIEQLRGLYEQAVQEIRRTRRFLMAAAEEADQLATGARDTGLALNDYRPNRASDQESRPVSG